jgi:hypothetical protein
MRSCLLILQDVRKRAACAFEDSAVHVRSEREAIPDKRLASDCSQDLGMAIASATVD